LRSVKYNGISLEDIPCWNIDDSEQVGSELTVVGDTLYGRRQILTAMCAKLEGTNWIEQRLEDLDDIDIHWERADCMNGIGSIVVRGRIGCPANCSWPWYMLIPQP
jgi:hypothetical protein